MCKGRRHPRAMRRSRERGLKAGNECRFSADAVAKLLYGEAPDFCRLDLARERSAAASKDVVSAITSTRRAAPAGRTHPQACERTNAARRGALRDPLDRGLRRRCVRRRATSSQWARTRCLHSHRRARAPAERVLSTSCSFSPPRFPAPSHACHVISSKPVSDRKNQSSITAIVVEIVVDIGQAKFRSGDLGGQAD